MSWKFKTNNLKYLILTLLLLCCNFLLAQRAIGGFSTGVTIPIKQNIGGLYSDKFNVGDLKSKYPSLTYNELKAIRQNNFALFKALCDSSIVQRVPVLLPAGELEMHINTGQRVIVPDSSILVIRGQNSTVETWPIVKSYSVVLFDLDENYTEVNNSLKISNCTFTSEPFRYETYNATLKPGGVTNQIVITDSYISTYAASKLVAGQPVVVNYTPTLVGFDYVIQSYNAGTKTITVTGALNGAIPNNDAGYIGLSFPEDTPIDTIRSRGEYWLEDNLFWTFSESIYGFGNNSKPVSITLENVVIDGFDTGISLSNVSGKVNVVDSYISCHVIAISAYSGNSYIRDYYVELTNSKFVNNGFIVYAYGAGVSITADNVYGSGTYFHPNIVCVATNCLFDNVAVNFRNYSGGGATDNLVRSEWQSIITACIFKQTLDIYNALFSEVMPTKIVNCSFEGGNVYANLNSTFQNCYFLNTVVVAANFNGATTYINNCNFYDSGVQGVINSGTATSKTYISNSVFYPRDGVTGATFDFAGSEYVEFNNCTIQGRALNANYALINGLGMCKKIVFNDCYIGAMTSWTFLFTRTDIYPGNVRPQVIFNRCELNTPAVRGNSNSMEQVFTYNECTFSSGFYPYYNADLSYFGKLKRQPNFTPNTHTSVGGIQTWTLDPNYNTFKLQGLTGKRVVFGQSLNNVIADQVNIIASDSLIITKFDALTNNTSNFMFAGNYSRNDAFSMYWDPFTPLYSGSTIITDTLGSVNGTQTYFSSHTVGTTAYANQLIPGTVTVTVSGQTFTDDGKGNLLKSGIYAGYIDYIRDSVYIGFSVTPAAGNVILSYSKYTTLHSYGCWRKI